LVACTVVPRPVLLQQATTNQVAQTTPDPCPPVPPDADNPLALALANGNGTAVLAFEGDRLEFKTTSEKNQLGNLILNQVMNVGSENIRVKRCLESFAAIKIYRSTLRDAVIATAPVLTSDLEKFPCFRPDTSRVPDAFISVQVSNIMADVATRVTDREGTRTSHSRVSAITIPVADEAAAAELQKAFQLPTAAQEVPSAAKAPPSLEGVL
jgi:hypothetical protein